MAGIRGRTVIPTALALLVAAIGAAARADDAIQADSSMGGANSLVQKGIKDGKLTYTITGGASRNSGRFLFHSFSKFNVPTNEAAHFDNAASVFSIFGRVTGLSPSQIDGLIKANGAANLYLINPKGIVFGPNARIDVGGAFVASTAKALTFGPGLEFSAENPGDPPLLTSDIEPGLQFGDTPAALRNEGVLVVRDGQRILLAGGPSDTVTSTGTLQANGGAVSLSGGTIKVGAEAPGEATRITADGGVIRLGDASTSSVTVAKASLSALHPPSAAAPPQPGAITLQGGDITVGASSGRTILRAGQAQPLAHQEELGLDEATAANLTLLDSSVHLKAGAGQTIEVFAGTPSSPGVTLLRAAPSADGNPEDANAVRLVTGTSEAPLGRIVVGGQEVGPDQILTQSSTTQLGTGVFLESGTTYARAAGALVSFASSVGALDFSGASLDLTWPDLQAIKDAEGAYLFEATGTSSDSGYIHLSFAPGESFVASPQAGVAVVMTFKAYNNIEFNNADLRIEAGTDGVAGKFDLNSSNGSILLTNSSLAVSGSGGGIQLTAANATSGSIALSNSSLLSSNSETAAAGSLALQGRTISVSNSQVTAETTGSGGGGLISVSADHLLMSKNAKINTMTTGTTADAGEGGMIKINASGITMNGGSEVTAQTSGVGAGGTIKINESAARDLSIAFDEGSRITAATSQTTKGGGQGGNIAIGTPGAKLTISGHGQVTAETTGSGEGGGITLRGGEINVSESHVRAETKGSGKGGMISVLANQLTMSKNAMINTMTSGTAEGSGDGGEINVNASEISMNDESVVTAQTSGVGTGGTIKINESAARNLSIAFDEGSRITAATSQTTTGGGQGGDIAIGTPRATLTISGEGQVTAETTGSGNGGGITLKASEINVNESQVIGQSAWSGRGGAISVTADQLLMENRASITTRTTGTTGVGGMGGAIELNAAKIGLLDGASATAETSGLGEGGSLMVSTSKLTLAGGSLLRTGATSSGRGGAININTSDPRDLSIAFEGDSWIKTTTSQLSAGGGAGGDIAIGKSGAALTIAGKGSLLAETTGSGDGGGITLKGGTINVNEGQAAARTSGGGSGGAIDVTAEQLLMSTGGMITTSSSGAGRGGDITIVPSAAKALSVSGGGTIEASRSGSGAAGRIRVGGTAKGDDTTAVATFTTLADGIQLKSNRSAIDVVSTEATTLKGVGLTATGDATTKGTIAVSGGRVSLGGESGRTVLLAGDGALASGEGAAAVPNLTLLDGGDSSKGGITVTGGEGKDVEIYSGVATPASAQGVTTVRGSTTVSTSGGSPTTERIVVGGSMSGGEEVAVSTTRIGNGALLNAGASNIYVNTTEAVAIDSGARLVGSTINLKAASSDPIQTKTLANLEGSTRWRLGSGVKVDITDYEPTSDRRLSIDAPSIMVEGLRLKSGRIWQMGSGAALDLQASGTEGIQLKNADLKFQRTGAGVTASAIVQMKASAGSIHVTSSKIQEDSSAVFGGGLAFEGQSVRFAASQLSTATSGSGQGGAIHVTTSSVELPAGSAITTSSSGAGRGGDITIVPSAAKALSVSGGGTIEASRSGSGAAGRIRVGGTAKGDGTTAVATTTTLADGIQLRSNRSAIDVVSTEETTLKGVGLTAMGDATTKGTIAVSGGRVSLGGESGRTVLLAGDGAVASSAEGAAEAPNLTLLDGGDSSQGSITVTGGAGKDVEIYSGVATPASAQGVTTLRGSTTVSAEGGAIAVRGAMSTSIAGASLKAQSLASGGAPTKGTIEVSGGLVSLGAVSGRTVLLAGDGALVSGEGDTEAPNLTLLDGGNSSQGSIKVTGGAGKNVEIYSGVATPAGAQGVTTLRGSTLVSTIASSPTEGQIVVGGVTNVDDKQGMMPRSATTSIGDAVVLKALNGTVSISGTEVSNHGTVMSLVSEINTPMLMVNDEFMSSLQSDMIKNTKGFKLQTVTLQGLFSAANLEGVGLEFLSTNVVLNEFRIFSNDEEASWRLGVSAALKLTATEDLKIVNSKIDLSRANGGKAESGAISIDAKKVTISNSQIVSNGLGGSVSIKSLSDILLDGATTLSTIWRQDDDSPTQSASAERKAGSISLKAGGIISLQPDAAIDKLALQGSDRESNVSNSTIALTAKTEGSGGAGTIGLMASKIILNRYSTITAETTGVGKGGDIALQGSEIKIQDAEVTAMTSGQGTGGKIDVAAGKLSLIDGGQLSVKATKKGNAGDINVRPDSKSTSLAIELNNKNSKITASTEYKGVIDSTPEEQQAKGGSIHIGASDKNVIISGKGVITAETLGVGKGGDIALQGSEIKIQGAEVTAMTSGQGTGGKIDVAAGKLSLIDGGQLSVKAVNKGNAGDINVGPDSKSTSLSIEFDDNVDSTITASTEYKGVIDKTPEDQQAKGGSIQIGASDKNVTISGKGVITAETEGAGKGGDIMLQGSMISIDQATVSARAKATQDLHNPDGTIIRGNNGVTGRAGNIGIVGIQNVDLSKSANVTAETATTGGGGKIRLDAPKISIVNDSRVTAQTTSQGAGGSIHVSTEKLIIQKGGQLSVKATNKGNAGDINVGPDSKSASLSIEFDDNEASTITASTEYKDKIDKMPADQQAKGGSIQIEALGKNVNISGKGVITAKTKGSGEGGEITLKGGEINVSESHVTAETTGSGRGGMISVAANQLTMSNKAKINTMTSGTAERSGDGGVINVNASEITMNDKSVVTAQTSSEGTGGTIKINASGITLNGGSEVTAETQGMGAGGTIKINESAARDLSIAFNAGSKITAATSQTTKGGGKGGDIAIGTPGAKLTISGEGQLTAKTEGSGEGGEITLKGGEINVSESHVTAETTGSGTGGMISVSANQLTMSKNATINTMTSGTTVEAGAGGMIMIDASEITMNDRSKVTAETQGMGAGGTIKINESAARDLSIAFDAGSKITAATSQTTKGGGKGGDIAIGTPGAKLTIRGEGQLTAETTGSGTGGMISVSANQLTMSKNATINTMTSGTTVEAGAGGMIMIDASEITMNDRSKVTAETQGMGAGGTIKINESAARDLSMSIEAGSRITAATIQTTKGGGKGGDIAIGTPGAKLAISGDGKVTTETEGSGEGGKITLKGGEINVSGSQVTAQTKGSGTGGLISATTNQLTMTKNAKINTMTTGTTADAGEGGMIALDAKTIGLSEESIVTAETQGPGTGGIITVATSKMSMAGGSVLSTQASSSGDGGTISINANATTPRDLSLAFSGASKITAATSQEQDGGGRGGDIAIGTIGATLAIGGDGRITAETMGSGVGGKVVLKGQPLSLANGTIVSTATSGQGAKAGAGGQLTVQTALLDINAATLTTASTGAGQAGQLIIVPEGNGPFVARFSNMSQITAATSDLFGGRGGSVLLDGGSRDVLLQGLGLVTVQSNGSGHAGTITLRGRTLTLDDQALLSAQTTGSGRGGSIDINADTIILDDGARITTSSNGLNQQATGPAGSIFITAYGPNSLHLRNGSEIDSFTSSSNPYTNDAELAHIFITTPNLTLSGNSRVNAMTTGAAKGGSIVLNTPSISLTRGSTITSETRGSGSGGQIRLDDPASPLRLSGGGTLTTATSGPGHGGDILVHTRRGTLDQGVTLTAATTGSGAGGTITVLSQQPLALRDGSTISARSTGGAGRAGDITIRTSELNLQDRSAILADGRDNGQAGNIRLTVDNDLRLANRSSINATTSRSGSSDSDNANIRIKVGGNLLLNNGSRIEASATGIANGGNLFLDISNGFLFASFPPSSPGGDVLASAERGSGGRIEVRALGLFGVNFNTFNTPISEVSAKSTAGRDGVVAIYNPYLTPDRGLIPIEQPIDVSNDVVRACAPRADGRRAEFTQSGRGGLPVQPGEVPTASPLLDDLGRPATSPAATSSQPPALRSLLIAQPLSTGDVPPNLAPQVLLPPCPEPR